MSNLSGCGTFFNFQEYTAVHTVVEVMTATGVEQYCVAIREGDGWLMCYELDTPIYCDTFGDVVHHAWTALLEHLGTDGLAAIDSEWYAQGCPGVVSLAA